MSGEGASSANHFDSDSVEFVKPTIQKQPARAAPMVTTKFARDYDVSHPDGYQSFIMSLGACFGYCGVIPCLCCTNPYQEVQQGNVGLVTRFGKLARTVDPGLTYVNTWAEKIDRVNVMIRIREVPKQACMTRDNVTVYLTSVLYYNITDPEKAMFGIADIDNAVIERTQTTLRDVVGARNLQEVVERREEIAESIEAIIAQTAADWGVHVESILIKDLALSDQVAKSLSMAAESKRIGESKIITAKAEVESAKLMRKAADILASKPAMQIRYLDAMQNMAKSANSKVIFMPSSGEVDKIAGQNMQKYDNSLAASAPIEEVNEHFLAENSTGGNFDTVRNLGLQEAYR